MKLDRLDPISLEELDERAALLKRVDVKRVVDLDSLAQLIDRLSDDHDVLEIDGRRRFGYRSVYFDTPDLRCYREHAAGITPRFKARTRHYVDTGACNFEVKVKDADGETDKRQLDHDPADAATLTPAALELLEKTVAETDVAANLITRFERITLAAREGKARLTIDVDVRLERLDGGAVVLRPELAITETKSEDGDSAADHALTELGAPEVSLSKYRVGADLLLREGAPDEIEELFTAE